MDWRGGRSGSGKTSWRLLTAVGAEGDGAGMWEVAGQGQEAVGLGVEIAGGLGGAAPVSVSFTCIRTWSGCLFPTALLTFHAVTTVYYNYFLPFLSKPHNNKEIVLVFYLWSL